MVGRRSHLYITTPVKNKIRAAGTELNIGCIPSDLNNWKAIRDPSIIIAPYDKLMIPLMPHWSENPIPIKV